MFVPDLHSDNVREALEDVKPYVEIDDVETESAADDEKSEAEEEDKEEAEKDEGPGFFARLIAKIKAFFASIFSRKEKKDKSPAVEEATVAAASNGE